MAITSSHILAIVLVLGFIAGQIYLLSKVMRKLSDENKLRKITTGIFAFAIVNIPSFIGLFNTDQLYNPSFSLILIFTGWIVGISIFGIVCLGYDYWQFYRKKCKKI